MPSEFAPTEVAEPTETAGRSRGRRAYVLKMYPRFSETFIVSEILAREAAGEELIIFSLRPSTDTRFHPELARVKASVIGIERPASARGFWQTWTECATEPHLAAALPNHLGELSELAHDDAIQALQIARLALEHEVTHLHAHFASVSTTVARTASALTGVPYSFTTHAKDIFHEDVVLADLARKTADADHVIAISEYNRRYLTSVLGPELSDRLVVVRNGLELERFPYRPRVGGGAQAADVNAASATTIPSLLAVGRLVEKKGFTHLLDALARLRDAGAPALLDLVGSGPLENELRERIDELGLGGLVTLHGALTQAEVREMFTSHDLLVAPFVIGSDGNADGLPTVLLEGMATGIPCIAGNVTAVPEVIDHDRTGWLVTGDDALSIAETIAEVVRRLRDTPAAVRAVTDAARRLVCELHDSRAQALRLAGLADAAVPVPSAPEISDPSGRAPVPSGAVAPALPTARELEHMS